MKAMRVLDKRKYEIFETEVPQVKPGHVLVKIHNTGICGSDVHLFWEIGRGAGTDYVSGHEFSGEIVDASDSKTLAVGDRVAVIDISPCGECEFCKAGKEQICDHVFDEAPGLGAVNGGFEEYCLVREDLVAKLPDNVSYTQGAMVEPVSISYHAAIQGEVKKGDHVLVTGAGPIGIFAAMSAKLLGAATVTITEANPKRLEMAQEDFADHALDGLSKDLEEQLKTIAPKGFDVVLECTGNQAAATQAYGHLKKGSKMVIVAVGKMPAIDAFDFTSAEKEIIGTIMFRIEEFKAVIDYMGKGEIDVERFASHIKLSDVQSVMPELSAGTTETMKYMIDISEN